MNPLFNMLQSMTNYKLRESLDRRRKDVITEDGMDPLTEEGYDPEFVASAVAEDVREVSEVLNAFATGKYCGESHKIKDVMTSTDFPNIIGAATEILMMNRIVPQRIVSSNLFQTIPYDGDATQLTIRTLGGVQVEEIAEGAPYPETSSAVKDQAYRMSLEIKKYGAKIAGTKEMINSDNWGIFGYTLAMMADELLNNKEKLCVKMLNEQAGNVLLDNAAASSVPLGSATGRGIDGSFNGALGLDDIMEIMAYMEMRGYYVDTVLMHPFAWSMWQRDPEIREVMLGSSVVHVPQGDAAPGWGDPFGSLGQTFGRFGSTIATADPSGITGLGSFNTPDSIFGKLGVSPYAYPNLTPFGATYMAQPKHVDRPLKVLVTPFVPYYKISTGTRAGKYATNLVFADSRKCGIILQGENPSMEQWEDIEREINFIKIKERFGITMQEQGRAVAVAKNIVIDRTYAFDNVNSVSLSAVSKGTNRI